MKILNRHTGVEIYSDDADSMRQTVENAVQVKVSLRKADLSGAVLRWAVLSGADLRWAVLSGADLRGAKLTEVDLSEADLRGADLREADLTGSDLTGAYLTGGDLTGADLSGAYLTGAVLRGAELTEVDLTGATMPDGRQWNQYRSNHLEGLCNSDEVRKRVVEAWGNHQWSDCPMHTGYGWDSVNDVPIEIRHKVANWITLYDSELLPKP